MAKSIVDILRKPEYTGENRCAPCTVLNLVIAAVLSRLIARRSTLGGVLAAIGSAALIYLRGYLLPGTPTLTKRYLPPAVLRWFGKDPEPTVASGLDTAVNRATGGSSTARPADESDAAAAEPTTAEESTGDESNRGSDGDATDSEQLPETVDLETYFREHGLVEPCEDRDDLCLADDVEAAWVDEMEPLIDAALDVDEVVTAFGFDADDASFELVSRDEGYVLRADASHAGTWPSRAALVADVAASRVLESRLSDWESYGPQDKGRILNGLRMFLEQCPSGGDVRMTEEAVESCCHPYTVVALVCEETGERLFEQPIS